MATEFFRVIKMKGFDRHQTPPWQMVPVDGDRYVQLRDGAGLTVTSTNPAVVTATEVNMSQVPTGDREIIPSGARIFKLHGASKGNARIQARNSGGTAAAELEVDTKNRKTVRVTWNFVRDNAGHRTWRARASTTQWVRDINHIYTGQANIEVIQQGARLVRVEQDLGTEVRRAAGAADERAVVEALGDTTADLNFFMVWEYESDFLAGTGPDRVDASRIGNTVFYEDRAGSQTGETMAHEIGHYLGVSDHYDAARKHHLMHGYTDERGVHLPKEDVNVMNP